MSSPPRCPHCGAQQLYRNGDQDVACLACGCVIYHTAPLPYIPERRSPSHRGPESRPERRQHRVR